jgi:hypothetical protein
MGFGLGIRGCARRGTAVRGAEPDFRNFDFCVVKRRRTPVFVLVVQIEPTMEVLNKVLWLVQLPNRYFVSKNSKSVRIPYDSIYSNLLPSHLPNYISRICHKAQQAHFLRPAFSSQTATPTHTFTFTHLTHFNHQKMAPPQIPSWLAPAVQPGLYFDRSNGNEFYLSDEVVQQFFREEMNALWMQSK